MLLVEETLNVFTLLRGAASVGKHPYRQVQDAVHSRGARRFKRGGGISETTRMAPLLLPARHCPEVVCIRRVRRL